MAQIHKGITDNKEAPMEYKKPYKFSVESPEQASYMIMNMCDNCSRYYCCSSADEEACSQVKRELASKYRVPYIKENEHAW